MKTILRCLSIAAALTLTGVAGCSNKSEPVPDAKVVQQVKDKMGSTDSTTPQFRMDAEGEDVAGGAFQGPNATPAPEKK